MLILVDTKTQQGRPEISIKYDEKIVMCCNLKGKLHDVEVVILFYSYV